MEVKPGFRDRGKATWLPAPFRGRSDRGPHRSILPHARIKLVSKIQELHFVGCEKEKEEE